MTKTDKQALRVKAERATQGEWWIDSHGTAMVAFPSTSEVMVVFVTDSNAMGPAVRHEDTGNLSHWRNDNDASFIAAANPQTMLALLDELEAAEKRNAHPDQWTRDLEESLIAATDRNTEQEKRISELEQSHEQVIHSRDHYKRVASEGIQSLSEARTLTVKLPGRGGVERSTVQSIKDWSDGWAAYREEAIKAILAAGIALDTGE